MLGRWAEVMLNGDLYAEIVDRHVELAGIVSWLGDVLDNAEPPEDPERRRRARSSPAARVEDRATEEWIADGVMMIVQLAAEFDRATLELALRIVPLETRQRVLSSASEATSKLCPEKGAAAAGAR